MESVLGSLLSAPIITVQFCWYYFPTILMHDLHHIGCVYFTGDEVFWSVSLAVHVLYYQPLCDFSFCLAVNFKFVIINILLQHWQQMIIDGL
jgi:hypothetical protein